MPKLMSYDKSEWDQFAQDNYQKDALNLYQQFNEHNKQGKYDIVLDIGCGTGNITFRLDGVLNVGQIYGLDLDENMIAFAKQNHMKDNISYITQDFGVEFDCMAPEVKALEGKVSLIVSNGCLQNIVDKNTEMNTSVEKEMVARNLYRLLNKGGKVYTRIAFTFNGYNRLTTDHKMWFKNIPQRQTDFNEWSNAFKGVGFHVIRGLDDKRTHSMNLKTFLKFFLRWYLIIWSRYYSDRDQEAIKRRNDELYAYILSITKRFTDETTGEAMVSEEMIHFEYLLQK